MIDKHDMDVVIEALSDLIALKDEKDVNGKTPMYVKGQPIAWENARAALPLAHAIRERIAKAEQLAQNADSVMDTNKRFAQLFTCIRDIIAFSDYDDAGKIEAIRREMLASLSEEKL